MPVLLRDLRESAEVFLKTEDSSINFVGHTMKEERNASASGAAPTRLGVTVYIFEGQGKDDDGDSDPDEALTRPGRGPAGSRAKRRRVDRRTGRKAEV